MMTYSGGGPAFLALPPKRSNPKSPLSTPFSKPNPAKAPRPSPLPLEVLTDPSAPDAARQIESMLNARPRTSMTQSRTSAPVLSGIGEDEWSRGFPEGHELLTRFYSEGSKPPTPEKTRSSVDLRDEGMHSFYTPGSSGSSIHTVRLSMDEPRPPTTPKSAKTAVNMAKKFLRRTKTQGSPKTDSPTDSLRRDSVEYLPASSLNASHRLQEQVALARSNSGKKAHSSSMEDIYIAIVGGPGVGKSTFVLRAYDLIAYPKKGELPALHMTVDGAQWNVRLVEIDWREIDFKEQPPVWPRRSEVPFIDGVCVLYDVTDPASFTRVPDTLDAFSKAAIPACLASTKGDMNRRPSAQSVESVGGHEQIHTSVTARDSQKRCIAAILALISDKKNDNLQRPANGRRRANSSAVSNRASSPRPATGHSRASSEFPSSFLKDSDANPAYRVARSQGTALGTLAIHSSPRSPPSPRSAVSRKPPVFSGMSAPYLEVVTTAPFSTQPLPARSSQSSLPSHASSDQRRDSYMSIDEDSLTYMDSDDIPILDRESEDGTLYEGDKPAAKGWTFDELVDRLLSPPVTKADQEFAVTFLLVYRRFAAPSELLAAIVVRFDAMEGEPEELNRLEAQLRYGLILHQWVTSHPGDCTAPRTRKKLVEFLTRLGRQRDFAFLSNEMFDAINSGVPDEDLDWAKPEEEVRAASNLLVPQPVPHKKRSQRSLRIPRSFADRAKRTSGISLDSESGSSSSQEQATPKAPEPQPHKPIASMYDMFMSLTVQEMADELTRIDSADLSKITARQVIRHQSLPLEARSNAPCLESLNNIIKRFNHIAAWVGKVVLERPKPKHRARALEKFMEIAWALRHMNNYNSLAAIIAGINGTAIHRLTITHDLVNPEIRKNFMRMELLMGTHKGHTKYRLAWENTRSERIPSIPVLRRDLVSADEGNKTFMEDGRINWNKFQVMGEIVQHITQAKEKPHRVVHVCPAVGRMIQESALTGDEDELYERSVKLENSMTPAQARSRRNWFSTTAMNLK